MGFIRKTLATATLGLVRGESKKQRVARRSMIAQENATREAMTSSVDVDKLVNHALFIGVNEENVRAARHAYEMGTFSHGETVEFLRGWITQQERRNKKISRAAG